MLHPLRFKKMFWVYFVCIILLPLEGRVDRYLVVLVITVYHYNEVDP